MKINKKKISDYLQDKNFYKSFIIIKYFIIFVFVFVGILFINLNKTLAENCRHNEYAGVNYFMDIKNEIWKDIPNYEGYYQVSNLGRIKSVERIIQRSDNQFQPAHEKILKTQIGKKGYTQRPLRKNKQKLNTSIHRLVALAFIQNPLNKPQVNHINGIKTDNRPENLEWVTNQENATHKINILGFKMTDEHKEKLKQKKIGNKIRAIPLINLENGIRYGSFKECAKYFNLSHSYFFTKFKNGKYPKIINAKTN